MKKVLIITNIYSKYRKSLFECLLNDTDFDFHFLFSKKTISNIETVKVEVSYSNLQNFHYIDNFFVKGRLVWQRKIFKHLLDPSLHSVIFLGEMTCISTWLWSFYLKLKSIKVIYWGHGIYGNERFLKLFLRKTFLKIPHYNLVYEKRAKQLMSSNGVDFNKIEVIYNSINFKEQFKLFNELLLSHPKNIFSNESQTLLFVGRLTPVKRLDLLLKAFSIINKEMKINLLIIGDGPLKKELKIMAKDYIDGGNCIFYGETYNEKELSKLIFSSDLTVSPGNVGLTAIHSLSYGTPVATHSNFNNQMPEVEAIIEGENGFLFQENNVDSMVMTILNWLKNNPKPSKKAIRNVVDQKYNPSIQKAILKSLLKR